jgi:hypothetical protein
MLNMKNYAAGRYILAGNMAHKDRQGRQTELKAIFIRSLHDVHEINAYRTGRVCLSARVLQVDNR